MLSFIFYKKFFLLTYEGTASVLGAHVIILYEPSRQYPQKRELKHVVQSLDPFIQWTLLRTFVFLYIVYDYEVIQ